MSEPIIKTESENRQQDDLKLDAVFDRSGLVIVIIGIAAAALSWSRIPVVGVLPVMYLHAVLLAFIIAIVLLRKRVSSAFKSFGMIGIFLVIGFGSLAQMGLVSGGAACLTTAAILTSYHSGRRGGVIMVGVIVAVAMVIFFARREGILNSDLDYEMYFGSFSSWATFAGVIVLSALAPIVINQEILAELKQRSATFQNAERELRRIVDAVPVATVLTQQRRFKFCNAAFVELFGSQGDGMGTVSQWLDRSCLNPISRAERAAAARSAFQESVKTGRMHKLVLKSTEASLLKAGNGRTIYVLTYLTVLDARSPTVLVSYVDISNEVLAEQKLKEVVTIFSRTEEAAQIGSWEYDIALRRLRASPQAFTNLRLPSQSPNEMHLLEIDSYFRGAPDDLKEKFERGIKSGEPWDIEVKRSSGNGQGWWAREIGRYVADLGRGGAIIGSIQDVTQIRELRRNLAETEKLASIGRLTGGLAHDINNMLAVVLGSAELIQMKSAADPRIAELATRIIQASTASKDLISRLLIFAGKVELNPQPIDLGAAVRNLAGIIRQVVGFKNLVTVEIRGGAYPVMLDAGMLEHSLVNLAANARDAMPDGGSLTITVSRLHEGTGAARRDWAVLECADTGVGMSDEIKKRLFEPFFTTKPKGEGTGLGLGIVHGFVAQSGGRIDVESEVGKGTKFRLIFPLNETVQANA